MQQDSTLTPSTRLSSRKYSPVLDTARGQDFPFCLSGPGQLVDTVVTEPGQGPWLCNNICTRHTEVARGFFSLCVVNGVLHSLRYKFVHSQPIGYHLQGVVFLDMTDD